MVFGPILVGLLLIGLPFLAPGGERSPRRRPWAVAIILLVIIMISTLWVAGAKSDWSPNFQIQPLPPAVVRATSRAGLPGSATLL